MDEIKSGDIVICINKEFYVSLTNGNEYKVVATHGDLCEVIDDRGKNQYYFKSRFKKKFCNKECTHLFRHLENKRLKESIFSDDRVMLGTMFICIDRFFCEKCLDIKETRTDQFVKVSDKIPEMFR